MTSQPGQRDGIPIEVLMDSATAGGSSWERAVGLKTGNGDPEEIGGYGWCYCALEELRWWAAPGEWRHV